MAGSGLWGKTEGIPLPLEEGMAQNLYEEPGAQEAVRTSKSLFFRRRRGRPGADRDRAEVYRSADGHR